MGNFFCEKSHKIYEIFTNKKVVTFFYRYKKGYGYFHFTPFRCFNLTLSSFALLPLFTTVENKRVTVYHVCLFFVIPSDSHLNMKRKINYLINYRNWTLSFVLLGYIASLAEEQQEWAWLTNGLTQLGTIVSLDHAQNEVIQPTRNYANLPSELIYFKEAGTGDHQFLFYCVCLVRFVAMWPYVGQKEITVWAQDKLRFIVFFLAQSTKPHCPQWISGGLTKIDSVEFSALALENLVGFVRFYESLHISIFHMEIMKSNFRDVKHVHFSHFENIIVPRNPLGLLIWLLLGFCFFEKLVETFCGLWSVELLETRQ